MEKRQNKRKWKTRKLTGMENTTHSSKTGNVSISRATRRKIPTGSTACSVIVPSSHWERSAAVTSGTQKRDTRTAQNACFRTDRRITGRSQKNLNVLWKCCAGKTFDKANHGGAVPGRPSMSGSRGRVEIAENSREKPV